MTSRKVGTRAVPDLKPYQQRVWDERDALKVKVAALAAFIGDEEKFKALSMAERSRLVRQQYLMHAYIEVLEERINAFD
jgi:hypothetical protein